MGWEKGEQAGLTGTPLFRKRLKLAKKTKEERKWLQKGPGNDNPVNKVMGCQWRERALMEGPGCREEKMTKETESRSVRGKEYPGSWWLPGPLREGLIFSEDMGMG